MAQPGTLTGSIGVANGKLDVSKAFRNQGINVDCVKVGQNANSQSLFSRFSKKQQTQVNALVDRYVVLYIS